MKNNLNQKKLFNSDFYCPTTLILIEDGTKVEITPEINSPFTNLKFICGVIGIPHKRQIPLRWLSKALQNRCLKAMMALLRWMIYAGNSQNGIFLRTNLLFLDCASYLPGPHDCTIIEVEVVAKIFLKSNSICIQIECLKIDIVNKNLHLKFGLNFDIA